MTNKKKKPRQRATFAQLERKRLIALTKQSDQIPTPENSCPKTTSQAVYDLTAGQCRFPIGLVGAKDFHFCQGRALEGSSYCDEHFRLTRSRQITGLQEEKNTIKQ